MSLAADAKKTHYGLLLISHIKKSSIKVTARLDWIDHFNALVHYSTIFGHCNCPRRLKYRYSVNITSASGESESRIYNAPLGQWLDDQRKILLGKKYSISDERKQYLLALVRDGRQM